MTKTFCDICGRELIGKDFYYLKVSEPVQLFPYDYDYEICSDCRDEIYRHIEKMREERGNEKPMRRLHKRRV